MFGRQTTVEKANEALEVAVARETEWRELFAARAAELHAIDASVGVETLARQVDGLTAEQVLADTSATTVRLREELAVAERAAAAAQAERVDAQQQLWAAMAAELRAAASTKRAEADRREARTVELLDALRDHEGVEYSPAPVASADGVVRPMWTPPTGTQLLRREAADLDEQADQLAARRVADHGAVSGLGIEELLENLAALGPTVAAPSFDEILAWADQAIVDARSRRAANRFEEAPQLRPGQVVFELVWHGSRVDPEASSAKPVHATLAN